jgi:hypothetical protein
MSYNSTYWKNYLTKYPAGTPTPVILSCQTCDKEFSVRPYRKDSAKFCSYACNARSKVGALSPHWKGGATTEREKWQGSLACREWRKAVFMRDNYTCVECGDSTGGNLQADHIKPWSRHPELRADVSNGRTLCIDCHKQTDTYGNKAKIARKI